MSESPDDIVGHKTFATGERDEYGMPVHRHEPLTRAEGEALWRHAQRCHEDRVARMPDEKSALQALHDAYTRLKDMGWRANPSELYGGADGLPFGMERNRGIGNAVSPDVAELIGRAIMASMSPQEKRDAG